MFSFCGNNSVNRYDPVGESFIGATLFGIAAWKMVAGFAGLLSAAFLLDAIVNNPPAFPEISLPRIEAKPKEKEVAPTLAKQPEKDPNHHIVAKAHPRAAESRQILRNVGIEPVTDPRNLVVLPKKYHASLHTAAYYNYVNERLRPVAGNIVGVEATLASLKAELLMRSTTGIRWD